MKVYHKIQTVWFREGNKKKGKLIENKWSKPEFELLKDIEWVGREKIHGENIRVLWDGKTVDFKGKEDTDNDNVNPELLKVLRVAFPNKLMLDVFGNKGGVCLYGEGFGHLIHQGKGYLEDSLDFRLFDIKIGEWWFTEDKLEYIANELMIDTCPIVYRGGLLGAIHKVRKGYESTISEDRNLLAEGLVLQPAIQLFNRKGERIITKIKYKDFKHE